MQSEFLTPPNIRRDRLAFGLWFVCLTTLTLAVFVIEGMS